MVRVTVSYFAAFNIPSEGTLDHETGVKTQETR